MDLFEKNGLLRDIVFDVHVHLTYGQMLTNSWLGF